MLKTLIYLDFNIDCKGADDGNGATVYKYSFDKYGNRATQTVWTAEGKPTIQKGTGVHGDRMTYDDYGNQIKTEFFDTNDSLTFCSNGYCGIISEFDENGFQTKSTFIDDKGKPVSGQFSNDSYATVITKNNSFGQPLEISTYDEFNNKVERSTGEFKMTSEYDSLGNNIANHCFNKEGKPTRRSGFESTIKYKYDEFNRVVEMSYYDENGKLIQSGGGSASIKLEYNRQGAITKIAYYGKDGNLQVNSSLYAYVVYEYDERGNETKHSYYNASDKLCMSSDGYATVVNVYDEKTNFITACKDYDVNGKIVFENHYGHDNRGNIIKRYTLDSNGNLKNGSVVTNAKYDSNNNQIEEWYTNLKGDAVNNPGSKYSKIKYKYDERGNCIETSWWTTIDTPTTHEDGTHRWVKEYNNLDQIIHDVSYDASGNPITGKDGNAEQRYEYDLYGHIIKYSVFDGHGKAVNGYDGWQQCCTEYNKRGKETLIEYLDANGNLVESKENSWAKSVYTYDSNNNNTETKHYDKKGSCTMIEKYKFNQQNRVVEALVCDGNGKPSDEKLGFSKRTISYESSGVVPKEQKYYNTKGQVLASSTFNVEKLEWNDLQYTSAAYAAYGYSAGYSSGYNSSWMSGLRAAAAQCPFQRQDGLVCTSISYTSTSVTFYMQLTGWSMYEMDEDTKSGIRSALYSEKSALRRDGEIPSRVSITIYYYDKAGRYIGSV